MIIVYSVKHASSNTSYRYENFIFSPLSYNSDKLWVFKHGILLFIIGYNNIPYYISSIKYRADVCEIKLRPRGVVIDGVSLIIRLFNKLRILNNNIYLSNHILLALAPQALMIPKK